MKKSVKRNLVSLVFFGIIAINFISAYSYGTFSIGSFFDEIGGENLILIATLIISFAVLNFALSRVFRDRSTGMPNKAVAGVISFALSLLITYGVYTAGFDLEGILVGVGISEEILAYVIPLIVVVGIIFLFWKIKSWTFYILGIGLIALSLTDYIYEKGIAMIAGIILLIIGFFWRRRAKKKAGIISGNNYSAPRPDKGPGFFKRKLLARQKRNEINRAEKEAYAEEQRRNEWNQRVAAKKQNDLINLQKQLQAKYNSLLSAYKKSMGAGNKIGAQNYRRDMNNITSIARNNGIQLNYSNSEINNIAVQADRAEEKARKAQELREKVEEERRRWKEQEERLAKEKQEEQERARKEAEEQQKAQRKMASEEEKRRRKLLRKTNAELKYIIKQIKKSQNNDKYSKISSQTTQTLIARGDELVKRRNKLANMKGKY